MKSFYEIWTIKKTYKFYIGDTLTISKNKRTYSHLSGSLNMGSVPFDMVNSLRSSGQLEQTQKWPIIYKVIEMQDNTRSCMKCGDTGTMEGDLTSPQGLECDCTIQPKESRQKDARPNDQKLYDIYEELSDSEGLDSIDISQL